MASSCFKGRARLLLVSARDKAGLQGRIKQVISYVNTQPNQLQNLAGNTRHTKDLLSHVLALL